MNKILDISPHLLDTIQDFDILIRLLAEGNYHGKRLSKKIGSGMEFNQYRPYSQGDDLRQLDWKMYARSGKFYIKQSEIETDVEVTFIIDNSASMLYKEEKVSKFNTAKILCALLCYIANKNGDRTSISGSPGISPGEGPRHWQRILHYLGGLNTTQQFIEPLMTKKRKRELIIIFSDLYDESEQWMNFIESLSSPKNEVIVFHLLGNIEKSLDLNGAYTFEDLESENKIDVMPSNLKSVYTEKISSWKSEIKTNLLAKSIDYHEIDFSHSISDIISVFINSRKQLL